MTPPPSPAHRQPDDAYSRPAESHPTALDAKAAQLHAHRLTEGNPISWRAAYRKAQDEGAGWSQTQAAEAFNQLNDHAGTAPWDGKRVSDFERWPATAKKESLTGELLIKWAKVYHTHPRNLLSEEEYQRLPPKHQAAINRPLLDDGHDEQESRIGSASLLGGIAPPDRAQVRQPTPPGRAGSVGAVDEGAWVTLPSTASDRRSYPDPGEDELVVASADQAADFGAWAESSNLGETTLLMLDQEARNLARQYLAAAPATVVARASAQVNRVFGLLRGKQYPQQTRELFAIAGKLSVLLAWISGDLGQTSAAEVQCHTAWTCAELADDNALRAWVLSTKSKTAFWDGRHHQAALLARRGQNCAPADTAAVLLACQEADAWAELGDLREASDALDRAADMRSTAEAVDAIGGVFHCGSARHANYAGWVRLRTGDVRAAIRECDEALVAYDSGDATAYGTLAQIHLTRSSAHLAAGDVEGAAAALSPVLRLAPDRRLDTIMKRLQGIAALLDQPALRGRDAVRLQTQIAEFNTAAQASRQISR